MLFIPPHKGPMFIFLSTLAICLTLIYIIRTFGYPRLEVYISPKPPEPAEGADPLPPPPAEVLLFCTRESEAFAREAMLQRAHKLYRDYGDWDKVLNVLEREGE